MFWDQNIYAVFVALTVIGADTSNGVYRVELVAFGWEFIIVFVFFRLLFRIFFLFWFNFHINRKEFFVGFVVFDLTVYDSFVIRKLFDSSRAIDIFEDKENIALNISPKGIITSYRLAFFLRIHFLLAEDSIYVFLFLIEGIFYNRVCLEDAIGDDIHFYLGDSTQHLLFYLLWILEKNETFAYLWFFVAVYREKFE